MKRPIAVYYHAYTAGGSLEGLAMVAEQMSALYYSGLASAAEEVHIGCEQTQQLEVASLCDFPCHLHRFPEPVQSELPTLRELKSSLVPGWNIFYHHTKGSYARSPAQDAKRRAMESSCVWNWRQCVQILEDGCDTCGEQWIEPVRASSYPPGQRYWAGNFWWAKSEYLLTLGPMIEPQFQSRSDFENRYEAEAWIGKSRRRPRFLPIVA